MLALMASRIACHRKYNGSLTTINVNNSECAVIVGHSLPHSAYAATARHSMHRMMMSQTYEAFENLMLAFYFPRFFSPFGKFRNFTHRIDDDQTQKTFTK